MRTTLLLILFFLAGGLRAADRTDDYLRNKPGGNTLDRGRWEKLKDDYKYKHLKEQKEKKKRKRSDFSLNFGNFDWLNVLAYAAIFLLIVGAIYWLARLGFFGNKALKEEKKGFNIFEDPEDLEQLDVDPLLMAALKMGDYRLAIRLHFLQMLKTLHTEKLITWKRDRTNHYYYRQLSETGFRELFHLICLMYEKVWYGNYPVNESGYSLFVEKFDSLQLQIKQPAHV